LSVLRWRLAKRSMPSSEPWPLRIARIATRSIHHCGIHTPRRMRQSGSALRKLIRSVAAAGLWTDGAGKDQVRVPPGETSQGLGWVPDGTDL